MPHLALASAVPLVLCFVLVSSAYLSQSAKQSVIFCKPSFLSMLEWERLKKKLVHAYNFSLFSECSLKGIILLECCTETELVGWIYECIKHAALAFTLPPLYSCIRFLPIYGWQVDVFRLSDEWQILLKKNLSLFQQIAGLPCRSPSSVL